MTITLFTDVTAMTGFQIDALAADTVITIDPSTNQPLTIQQVRALGDQEWPAWNSLNRKAWEAAYAVHIRGSWDAVVEARRIAKYAAHRAEVEIVVRDAAKPKVEEFDFTLTGPTTVVTVTPAFYDDHVGRDCRPGEVLKRTKSTVTLKVDAATYNDLLSDAIHYTDAAEWGSEYLGLASSARATVKRLRKAGAPGT
jgi:hypothetical protein